MDNDIKTIEEALFNSIPALQTVLLGGWVIRLNRNYTYRANCVCPLYDTGGNVTEKVKKCEELFRRNKLPSVFKVTPALQSGLSDVLLLLNYQKKKIIKKEPHRKIRRGSFF
ncbi:hypothetical protein [Caproiciproducens galactitolivorans]|uniref:hypothetical protein n=1 Tax=Caproiciproducens galactitolivorans TaxID=642589 RepID=UPI00240A254D|nr:hypothetical protein [Caproiciproducens galactitolivorans]